MAWLELHWFLMLAGGRSSQSRSAHFFHLCRNCSCFLCRSTTSTHCWARHSVFYTSRTLYETVGAVRMCRVDLEKPIFLRPLRGAKNFFFVFLTLARVEHGLQQNPPSTQRGPYFHILGPGASLCWPLAPTKKEGGIEEWSRKAGSSGRSAASSARPLCLQKEAKK